MARLEDVKVNVGEVHAVVARLRERWSSMSDAERDLAAERLREETRMVPGPGLGEFTLIPPEGL